MTTLDVAPPVPQETAARPASGTPTGARLRRGGATFAVSQFGGMALGFLGSMVLVRIASQDELGVYFRLLQAITAVGLLLQLGLGPAALRFVPISRGTGGAEATACLRRRLFRIQITLWAVLVPPLALAWPWIARRLNAPELARATAFLVGAALLASFGSLVDNYLRAFRMYTSSALLSHLAPRALLLAGFLALWWGAARDVSWEALVALYLASQLAASFGYATALAGTTRGETSEPRAASPPPDIRTILGTTTAMGLRSAASILFVSSDLWILGLFRASPEVAVYGIAGRILQVMAALPGIVNFLIPQEFAVLYADGRRKDMERLARTASTTVAIVSAVSLLGILLFGRPLLRIAFHEAYMGAWSILLILGIGTFWDTASGSAGFALQMSGHHNRLLLLTVGAAALNVALGLALAPLWGGPGVALATTITLIVLNLAMVASARRLVGIRTYIYLRPALWREVLWQAIGSPARWREALRRRAGGSGGGKA